MSENGDITPGAEIVADHMARTVQFLAKTSLGWNIWKETEPEFFWLFERVFESWKVTLRFTGDEYTFLVEVELPLDKVSRLEKAFKDNSLAAEIDKIHGIDPILHRGRKDVKLSKLQVSLAPALPQNVESRKTIEALERRLIDLELHERARSIDLRVVMQELQAFQVEMQKKLEDLEKKVEDGLFSLGAKCEKMEKAVLKYKP